jgi:hypothetical protein
LREDRITDLLREDKFTELIQDRVGALTASVRSGRVSSEKTGARGAGLRGWGGSLTDRWNLTRVMPA